MGVLKKQNPNPQQIKIFCNFLVNHKKKNTHLGFLKNKQEIGDSGGLKRNLPSSSSYVERVSTGALLVGGGGMKTLLIPCKSNNASFDM